MRILGALEALKTMEEHRAVLLSEDALSDLDDKVRAHSQDLPVEGGAVELAGLTRSSAHQETREMRIRPPRTVTTALA